MNNRSMSSLIAARRLLAGVAVVLLPFAVFYWLNPLTGNQTIGNDYVSFSIDHQLALQYSIEKGSCPLFVPGFAGGGHSSAALTLGQLHHPIAHLASHLPGYWTGDALQVNTVLKLLFIGAVHLVLLLLLRRLRLPSVPAFILSFITVYNLRMLDMFRYGASLENYLGSLLLLSAVSFEYLSPSRVRGPLFIALSTYLLVCGGHPQIMYLGLLGVGMISAVLPYALGAVLPEAKPDRARLRQFYLRTAVWIGVGITLSAAYILPFYFEFIQGNAGRVARAYKWSLGYSDTWGGTLSSFFRPLHADVHGAFGSSSLIVWVFFAPIAALLCKRAPRVVYVLFGLCLLVFLVSLGGATPLHYLFWKGVPLFDAFRTPGRINLILPFLFLLMLAWWMQVGVHLRFRTARLSRISPVLLLSLFAVAAYLAFNLGLIDIIPKPGHYTPQHVNKHPFIVQQVAYWLGLASLIIAAVYWSTTRLRAVHAAFGLLLCLSVVAQCGLQLRYGTWVTTPRKKPTLAALDKKMSVEPAVPGLTGFGMESGPVASQMAKSALAPDFARFYRTFQTFPDNAAADAFIADRRRANVAAAVSDAAPKPIARCAVTDPACPPDTVETIYTAYNRVALTVDAQEEGLLALSFPYFSNWRAFVDEKPVPAVRTEGYAVGAIVPEGRHRVEFRFFGTWLLAGLLAAGTAILGAAVFFSLGRRRLHRLLWIGSGALVAGGVVLLPYRTFFSGENLNTRYRWSSKELPDDSNIALFKTAAMSSIRSQERAYSFYAGRAVDGDKATACRTASNRRRPWWQVDLGSVRPLDAVEIYTSSGTGLRNLAPLKVLLSDDGDRFRQAVRLNDISRSRPLRISLDGASARFIRIQSEKSGTISFSEVEVFAR